MLGDTRAEKDKQQSLPREQHQAPEERAEVDKLKTDLAVMVVAAKEKDSVADGITTIVASEKQVEMESANVAIGAKYATRSPGT